MSVKEVIDRAAELGGWRIDKFGGIVRTCDGRTECPITSLVGLDSCRFIGAAESLHIDSRQMIDIVDAADDARRSKRAQLIRAYMLRKFGLPASVPQGGE
jgi:hypothetical protein